MPRSHALIYCSIWDPENDYRDLPFAAQWAYEMLITQPEMSPLGVMKLDWKNWASNAADITTDDLEPLIDLLAERGYVVVDHDTDELWIRTHMYHDRVFKQSQIVIAAARSVGSVRSLELRRLIAESVPPGVREHWPNDIKDMKRGDVQALLDRCSAADWKPSVTPNNSPLKLGVTPTLTLGRGVGDGEGDGVGESVNSKRAISKSLTQETVVRAEPTSERDEEESGSYLANLALAVARTLCDNQPPGKVRNRERWISKTTDDVFERDDFPEAVSYFNRHVDECTNEFRAAALAQWHQTGVWPRGVERKIS